MQRCRLAAAPRLPAANCGAGVSPAFRQLWCRRLACRPEIAGGTPAPQEEKDHLVLAQILSVARPALAGVECSRGRRLACRPPVVVQASRPPSANCGAGVSPA